MVLPFLHRVKEDSRQYFKLLPANDYAYDYRAALNFFALLGGARGRSFIFGEPPAFRFLARVENGRAALYFGCAQEYAGVVRGAFAGAYPKVSLQPLDVSPVAGWRGGALTEFYAAGGKFLPFRKLEGPPALLTAALTALGAGRDAGPAAVLDVCFSPLAEKKIREQAEAEARKAMGLEAGDFWGEVKEALFSSADGRNTVGGARRADPYRAQGRMRAASPSSAQALESLRSRFLPPERPYLATVRVAVKGGGPEKPAELYVMDAAASLAAMSYLNKLERSGSHGLGDRVALGSFGERLLLSGGELASLVVVPGPDSPLWPSLERDVARTAAPPAALLAGDN